MDNDLLTKIQDAVRASLPAHLSDELQKVLADAALTKTALKASESSVKVYSERSENYKAQLEKHIPLERRETEVSKREQEVLKRETNMALLEFKAEAAYSKAEYAKEIVKAVFQNNHYKYQRNEQGYIPVVMPGNNCPSSGSVSKQITEETVE